MNCLTWYRCCCKSGKPKTTRYAAASCQSTAPRWEDHHTLIDGVLPSMFNKYSSKRISQQCDKTTTASASQMTGGVLVNMMETIPIYTSVANNWPKRNCNNDQLKSNSAAINFVQISSVPKVLGNFTMKETFVKRIYSQGNLSRIWNRSCKTRAAVYTQNT